ncbi:hypothetical protein [Actinophytocola sediminis]
MTNAQPPLGNAGYSITGSGGGGSGGRYVFASLEELDAIIGEWARIRDEIRLDGRRIMQAQNLIRPPADDIMSRLQQSATNSSLDKALTHNAAMVTYVNSYIEKLSTAKSLYASDDEQNAARMRDVNEH